MSASQSTPYCDMQNGPHNEKEKGRENIAKNKMVETEGKKLSKAFRQEVTRILGGEHGLPNKRNKTAEC